MKTIDLRKKKHSIEELLEIAVSDSLMIYSKEGNNFILEKADDFEQEVAKLGESDKFMKFLDERSKDKTVPFSTVRKELDL